MHGTDEWLENYDALVMPLIDSYHTVVLPWSAETAAAVTAAFERRHSPERT